MYPLIFSRLAVEVDFKTASAELHYHLSRSSTALKCKEIKDSKLSLKSIILINSNKHKELIEVGEGAHKRFEDICSVISFPDQSCALITYVATFRQLLWLSCGH